MRVYHILPEGEPFSEFSGGALSRWAANVVRDDTDAVIVAPAADASWGFPGDRVRIVSHSALVVKWLGRMRAPWPIQRQSLQGLFAGALSGFGRNDVLWIHNRPQFAAALAPLARRRGGQVVLHMQNVHLSNLSPDEARQLHVDRSVFCSDWLRQHALARQRIGETSVIYNGANESLFYPPAQPRDNPAPVILFAGRVVPEKGVHVLADAMRILLKRGLSCKAVIAGASNFGGSADTEYLRSLRRDAPANLEFAGYFSGVELAERFRSADIFCSPATWEEPFGLVNAEAMASGLPVVTTRGGGAPEIFSSGGGILVARNSAPELADALHSLVADAGLRTSMGRQGLAAFRARFTWKVARSAYRQLLSELPGQS